MARRSLFWISCATAFLLLCLLLSLSWGEMPIYPWQWTSLEKDSMEAAILTRLRLPRTLTALCIGGMLSMSGCLLQGLFKNPLVEPYTLGLSGGASLGVAAAFVSGMVRTAGFWSAGIAAFAGALAVSLVLLLYTRGKEHLENLLLAGIMTGILCSSLTTLLMSLSSPQEMTRIIYWTMGSVENNDMQRALLLCAVAAAGLITGTLLSRQVNMLSAGGRMARSMGVNTATLIPALLVLASALTAVSVACAGIIGFVGLVVPHILRRTASTDYRLLIPLSFVLGGAFLILCDLLARTLIAPTQLPIGVVSGIAGGSLFVYLLTRKNAKA